VTARVERRQRVVVVGGGMVGTRFVDELLAADTAERYGVTVIGAEDYDPYNRVLLSDVLAGHTDLASLQLPARRDPRVQVLRGRTATDVDRQRRLVTTDDGGRHPYDLLVLATGARAHVPDLPGLNDQRPAGAHVLRSVDDCREVVAATVNARRAVVVGGGLLGLEAAVGLLQRGLAVTLVHHREHLLDRQLDPPAAAVLAAAADDLGLSLVVGSCPTAVTTRSGRVTGVSLDGGLDTEGGWLPADVLLLACGTRPETALAAGAGLQTDRGVLVSADLRSPDDTCVAAIGDCAQPPEGGTGLVAQGWEQARRLARSLARGPSCPAAGTSEGVEVPGEVVRLKAKGLDVVTMGSPDVPGARTVTLDDPDGRRHLRVSVRGDRLVGATCVGAGELAADLVAAFDRGTPVPLDPAALLVRSAVAAPVETSPTLLPARATVCRCNGVTKGDLVQAWEEGAGTVAEVAACTRATTGCGGCRGAVEGILGWLAEGEPDRGAGSVAEARASGDPARLRGTDRAEAPAVR
jgi:assimilatory nitrate reductase electron transfer subunit